MPLLSSVQENTGMTGTPHVRVEVGTSPTDIPRRLVDIFMRVSFNVNDAFGQDKGWDQR